MKLKKLRFFLIGIVLLLLGSTTYGNEQKLVSDPPSGSGKVFVYLAKKFGVPILRASIKIENGSMEQGKPLYQIQALVDSLNHLGILFRINNRFTSTLEADTYFPIRYVKEINQEGLLIGKKNYLQTFFFDNLNKKVVVEKKDRKEKQEISIPTGTFDPLSMFAWCYLKEELHPEKDIHMSIYDGVKLRQMVFHPRKEKVKSKMFGEVEAICLESTTSFSTFGEKEGTIRIWYTNHGEKIPILMDLELPVGNIRFDLESINRS